MKTASPCPASAPAFVPPADADCNLLGRTIAGKYVLRERIGTGSMGSVYRARHTALGRDVALKLMAPELARDRSFVARFRREALAASRLTHASSVATTDFGEEPDGLLYLVMEYVAGQSLELLAEREVLSEARIVHILSQVLSAVGAAHDAGIVHRDLKPANVLVTQTTDDDGNAVEHVKVCDFGVASLRDRMDLVSTGSHLLVRDGGSHEITMAGAVVGTPAYMAPEQAGGGTPDARADLYAVGVILFELLTGRLPIYADTPEETMARQIDSLPPSPREFVDCTAALADVCLRALAKPLAQRYESARSMRAALRTALEADGAAPSAPSSVAALAVTPAPVRPRARHWPLVLTALVVGAVASTTWLARKRPAAAAALPEPTPLPAPEVLAAPAATASAPAAAYVADRAHVRAMVTSTSGLRPTAVHAAVRRVDLDRCYRSALGTLGRPEAGHGTVAMYVDGDGAVKSTRVRLPPALGDATACIVAKLRGLRVSAAPESGSALATLTLAFEP